MTRKKTRNAQGKGSNNGFQGFLNPTLNADIKAAVKALVKGSNKTAVRIEEMAQSGFKVGVGADKSNTHFTFTAFDKRPQSDSQGYVLSVKHSNIDIGFGLLWVLIYEIYEGKGWGEWITPTYDVDW